MTVITGFLGAGKTTLLRRFLATTEGQGTAVVVNEFGATGIDDALVRPSADQTLLLGNGCLCCNVRSDLQVALRKLISERERGLVPHFRRVVIETSGLADPGPILRSFATDRALGGECHVDAVIAVAARAGAPVAELLRAEAARRRRTARADGTAKAAALGVRLMLPLGVCVLPAFVLLGVVPLIVSVVTGTLGAA